MSARKELWRLLYKNSFLYDPIKGFNLSSGGHSDVYFDCKKTTLTSQGMMLVGQLFWEEIKGTLAEGIGGLSLGADPIVCATVMHAAREGKEISGFLVRKEPKKYGTQRWIEGLIKKGMKVVIVDDVVTTGSSVIKAIYKTEEAGLEVIKVITLIDREEGGKTVIEGKGYEYIPLFTRSDFIKLKEKFYKE